MSEEVLTGCLGKCAASIPPEAVSLEFGVWETGSVIAFAGWWKNPFPTSGNDCHQQDFYMKHF